MDQREYQFFKINPIIVNLFLIFVIHINNIIKNISEKIINVTLKS